jgi:hypothetical protein
LCIGMTASFQRNSSPVNLLAGRPFQIHWRSLLAVMGCLPIRTAPCPPCSARRSGNR